MTDTTTFRRFSELMNDGFRIDEVSSTWDHVIVEMQDGPRRKVVRMDREAARSILAIQPARTQRVPASTR